MSFDLYITPPSGFLDWDDAQWEQFFSQEPENEQLGKSLYVGLVLDAITHNLEGDKPGSRYPTLMRIDAHEKVGWYLDEVGLLLKEIEDIKARLSSLPINRSTLNYDNDEDVARRISDFKKYNSHRSLSNLYDLNFHFLQVFEMLAKKALEAGHGLAVLY